MKSFYLILLEKRIRLCDWCVSQMNKLIIKEVRRKGHYEEIVKLIKNKKGKGCNLVEE